MRREWVSSGCCTWCKRAVPVPLSCVCDKTPKGRLHLLCSKIGGEVLISRRGVPYLKFLVGGEEYSVAYFGRNDFYRVFRDNGWDQDRLDFKNPDEVVAWVEKERRIVTEGLTLS